MPEVSLSGSERLSHLLSQGIKLPPLPASGLELMNILRQRVETLNINHIAGLVENDPTLAANLLRMANSPMYGAARGVNRVHQAIVTMGLDETVQMLNYYLLRKLFPKIPEFTGFSAENFWQHAWACASAARLMGQPQYLVHCLPGELYLAGLLHDIGKVVFAIYLPEDFAKCLEQAAAQQQPLDAAELEIIGVDHATVGASLLDSWNLPAPILQAIDAHHDPSQLPEEEREFPGLIQLANTIAHNAMGPLSGNPAPQGLHDSYMFKDGKSPLVKSGEKGILLGITEQLRAKAAALAAKKDDAAPAEQKQQPAVAKAAPAATQVPAAAAPQHEGGLRGWAKRLFKSA